MQIPISAIIPTIERAAILQRTLESLTAQGVLPAELIVVDGSIGDDTKKAVLQWGANVVTKVIWERATTRGAAAQRNQGVAIATQPYIWFFDDDILFESDCVTRLWLAIEADPKLGGVNAMITNQRYHPPRIISRTVFALLNSGNEPTFAGRLLGPAVNLLPEDGDGLPEVVPTEWLNTTCTIYRREALPDPPFHSIFTGYSMMEDVSLSVMVGRHWNLANARTARIFHDSQPGAHKSDPIALAEMQLVNRHYVMTRILGRTRVRDYAKLIIWEMFQLATGSRRGAGLRGKLRGLRQLLARPDGR